MLIENLVLYQVIGDNLKQNVTFSIGNLALIDKVDAQTDFFRKMFTGVSGKAKNFIPCIKLLMYNKLGNCTSINRVNDFLPQELAELLGFKKPPSAKQFYRAVERLGEHHSFVLENYQQYVKNMGLIDDNQFTDFSSSYFEGSKSPLGELGYSRDGQSGKKQLTFGVSVGLNGVPATLTIQKGNVADKTHMKRMIRLCSKILPSQSLLTFDCGGNTREIKAKILQMKLNYLTLKAKHKSAYVPLLKFFHESKKQVIECNGMTYSCVKINADGEVQYVFFSQKLYDDQMRKKKRKFAKALENGGKLLKKVRKRKPLSTNVCLEGWIVAEGRLQKSLALENPFITGLEGYFVLESSLNVDSEKILWLYKNRDKAEKLIRDLKEGAELRPFRHWTAKAVKGVVLLVFLTNALVRLTQFLNAFSLAKNLKLLKKYLTSLTLSVIYRKNGGKSVFVCNFSEGLKAFFGGFLQKYAHFTLTDWT